MNLAEITIKINQDLSSLNQEDVDFMYTLPTSDLITCFKSMASADYKQNKNIWPVFSQRPPDGPLKTMVMSTEKAINNQLQKLLLVRVEDINERVFNCISNSEISITKKELVSSFSNSKEVNNLLRGIGTDESKGLIKEKREAKELVSALYFSVVNVYHSLLQKHKKSVNPHLNVDKNAWAKESFEELSVSVLSDISLLGINNSKGKFKPSYDPATYLIDEGKVKNLTEGPLRGQKNNLSVYHGLSVILGISSIKDTGSPGEEYGSIDDSIDERYSDNSKDGLKKNYKIHQDRLEEKKALALLAIDQLTLDGSSEKSKLKIKKLANDVKTIDSVLSQSSPEVLIGKLTDYKNGDISEHGSGAKNFKNGLIIHVKELYGNLKGKYSDPAMVAYFAVSLKNVLGVIREREEYHYAEYWAKANVNSTNNSKDNLQEDGSLGFDVAAEGETLEEKAIREDKAKRVERVLVQEGISEEDTKRWLVYLGLRDSQESLQLSDKTKAKCKRLMLKNVHLIRAEDNSKEENINNNISRGR